MKNKILLNLFDLTESDPLLLFTKIRRNRDGLFVHLDTWARNE